MEKEENRSEKIQLYQQKGKYRREKNRNLTRKKLN